MPQKKECPACKKPYLRKRVYKDSILYVHYQDSILYVHKEKGGLFGFIEITKACDVKKV
jgi:hypothetical protein